MSELPPEGPEQEAPPPEPTAPEDTHPARLIVNDDLNRSRLTVFFRLILAIPHLIWITLWTFAAYLLWIVAWLVTLFVGRLPLGMHNFLVRYQGYTTHFTAYLYLLANPYPPFHGGPGAYPVDLHVDPPERQSRLKVGFRLFLAIPALILMWVFQQVMQILAFLGWFACLALGRMPKGMRDLGIYCLRYQEQTYCYFFFLTQRYPSLSAPSV